MDFPGNLPSRLKQNPLLDMETDADVEAIAEAACSPLWDDGEPERSSARALLTACLGYLRDWCPPAARTWENLFHLVASSLPDSVGECPALDALFYEIRSGCKQIRPSSGLAPSWEPSLLTRRDGLMPRETNGIQVSDDFSLSFFERFRRSVPAAKRELVVNPLLAAIKARPST